MKKLVIALSAMSLALASQAGMPKANMTLKANEKVTTVKSGREMVKVQAPRLNAKLQTPDLRSGMRIRRADELTGGNTGTALTARYVTPPMGCFYVGMSPTGLISLMGVRPNPAGEILPTTVGFGGCRGNLPFINFSTGATSYQWSYETMNALKDQDFTTKTSTDELLMVPVNPYSVVGSPELVVSNGSKTASFIDYNAIQFFFADQLRTFNIAPSNYYGETDVVPDSDEDYFGLTTAPTSFLNYFVYIPQTTKDCNPAPEYAAYYNDNGTCIFWDGLQSSDPRDPIVTNIRFSGIMNTLPQQNRPYLLGSMWMPVVYETKGDVKLEVLVCEVDAEGYLHIDEPIGQGEIFLNGNNTNAMTNADLLIGVDLESIVDGFPTSDPVVINGEAAVIVTGIDNENLTYFQPFYAAGTTMPKGGNLWEYYNCNAYGVVEFDVAENLMATPEPQRLPVNMGAEIVDEIENGVEWGPTDFAMNFDILFPMVLDSDANGMLIVEVPDAGGDASLDIFSTFSIPELLQDGVMTKTLSEDWFTCEVEDGATDEDFAKVKVTAQALPADVKGRVGHATYTGYGMDFVVNVVQGEVDLGISQIAAADGVKSYYDLQGRRLSGAPSHGIYIERSGNKAVKRMAR